jgi:hypothetical protein
LFGAGAGRAAAAKGVDKGLHIASSAPACQALFPATAVDPPLALAASPVSRARSRPTLPYLCWPSLPLDPVPDVFLGRRGLLAAPGGIHPSLFINVSTIEPDAARELAQRVGRAQLAPGAAPLTKGARPVLLDAPATGGVVGAERGELCFSVGCDEAADLQVGRGRAGWWKAWAALNCARCAQWPRRRLGSGPSLARGARPSPRLSAGRGFQQPAHLRAASALQGRLRPGGGARSCLASAGTPAAGARSCFAAADAPSPFSRTQAARLLLDIVGSHVTHTGPVGTGSVAKLVRRLLGGQQRRFYACARGAPPHLGSAAVATLARLAALGFGVWGPW